MHRLKLVWQPPITTEEEEVEVPREAVIFRPAGGCSESSAADLAQNKSAGCLETTVNLNSSKPLDFFYSYYIICVPI